MSTNSRSGPASVDRSSVEARPTDVLQSSTRESGTLQVPQQPENRGQDPQHCRTAGRADSVRTRRSVLVGSPPVRLQHRLQCSAQPGEVAGVDPTVAQLAGELTEEPLPVSSARFAGNLDLHDPFHHANRSATRRRSPLLLPRSVPAGGGAPLGDRSAASGSDRSTAPAAMRRGGPSSAVIGRRRDRFAAGNPGRCLLRVAAPPLSLSFSPTTLAALAASAAHAADAPDKPPETRHNKLRNPKVKEV
jgi:hypothetical protein